VIIELTGIPGSGKSTILNELQIALGNEKYVFDIQKYILGFNGNTLIYDIYLFLNFYRLTLRDWRLLGKIFNIIYYSKNSFFHKINIYRNSYKKLLIYNIINPKNEIFFVDEGVTHIPFTLFVDIENSICETNKMELINCLQKIDLLLIIDAPDDILLERVLKRGKEGHRRIDFTSKKKVISFLHQSRQVLNSIEKSIRYEKINNINPKIDIKKIIKIIGINNV